MQPYSIKKFAKVLEELSGLPAEQFPLDGFYVVSNAKNYFGATAITYPEVVEKLKAMLGDDIVIVPATIHECIVFSPQTNNDGDINNIIRQVNETAVDPSERLSDHIYTYDESGNLISAEDMQAQAS